MMRHAACGICHDARRRAAMVTDLKRLEHGTNAAYWRHWVEHGKAGTLMPAFSDKSGGPLTRDQIDSLVAYLQKKYPSSGKPLPVGGF